MLTIRNQSVRLAILTLYPIHYQIPLWRRLVQESNLDLTVFFCSDEGMGPIADIGYGQPIEWGVPLLGGYRHVFLHNLQTTNHRDSFRYLFNPGVVRMLLGGRYDALFVHAYNYATQLLAIILARRLGMKVLVRSEPTLIISVNPPRRRIKEIVLPWLFQQVNACMAIGSLNREYYRYFGVSDDKIFLMPYAVDNNYFFSQREDWAPHRERIKLGLGISASKVILYVGRFLPRKRVVDLIQAFETLGLPDVALALVGSGQELEACQQYVRERHLPHVHFLGFRGQTELPKLYAISDVLVLPSEDEPWGLVINEAMCFGLPIIASDRVGAAADLVRPGRNGFVYPFGDVERLCQALRLTFADGAQTRLGRASLEIIQQWGFDQDVVALRQALRIDVDVTAPG